MIFEKIRAILVEELNVEEENVKPESKIKDDLGADSLDLFELINKVEDEFDVSVEEDDYDKLITVGNMVDYINKIKKNA